MCAMTKLEEGVASIRFRSLGELMNRMNLTWLARKNYTVISSLDELKIHISEAENYKIWAVDTETTGLMICNLSQDNPEKDHLAGICISWKRDQGIYIPLRHTRFANLPFKETIKYLRPYLETKDIVCHNGQFDGRVFYDIGIRLNIKHDTLLLYFNVDSNVSKGSKGLKALTEKKYNYEVIEFEDIFFSSKDHGLFIYLPKDLVRAYACADSDHTLQLLFDSFHLLTPGQRRSYNLDILVQNELVRSDYYGKGIDMALCKTLDEINTRDLTTIAEGIYHYAHYLICQAKGIDYSEGSYVFNIGSSADVSHLFYSLLGYKPLKFNDKTNQPSVDKFVLKAMLKERTSTPLNEIEESIISRIEYSCISEYEGMCSKKGKDDILVNRGEFSNYLYKLPYLIQIWRKLEKFRTSFFGPLLNNNFEGKYFSTTSMTRTQTARLIDPIQTLVGSLKKLIVPYDREKQYMMDFDFAQIEYRVMAGLSGIDWLVERLCNPEADYHREGGSLILGKAPEEITKSERSSLKSINFGIPYGMSEQGICESRYGIGLAPDVFEEKLKEIKELLSKWHAGLNQIWDMLENYRDIACTELPQSDLPDTMKGQKIGRIANPLGRTRVFYLERRDGKEFTQADYASIRRQAGNYPIQSYAREIFCNAFVKLCNRLKKEGLMDVLVEDPTSPSGYRFENKCIIIAYIHDECLMNIDKSVNPNLMHKFILEECMQVLKGHPNYYSGAAVINNWYEGKSDIFEAPIGYVQEMREMIDNGTNPAYDPSVSQRDYVLKQIEEWIAKRSMEEIEKFLPNIKVDHILDMSQIRPYFTNYFVKPKMFDFFGLWRQTIDDSKVKDPKDYKDQYTAMLAERLKGQGRADDFTQVLLETFLLREFGNVHIIYEDGTETDIKNNPDLDETNSDLSDDWLKINNHIYRFNMKEEDNLVEDIEVESMADGYSMEESFVEEQEYAIDEIQKELKKTLKDSYGLTKLFDMVEEDMRSSGVLHF